MAKLPDALERRNVLYGNPRKVPDFKQLGDDYRSAGRLSDACEAYEKIDDESTRLSLIRDLKNQAISEGSWFILNRIHRTAEPVDAADWKAAFDNATAAGKLHFAHKIAVRLEDPVLIEELEKALGIYKAPELPELPKGEQDEGDEAEAEAEAAAEG